MLLAFYNGTFVSNTDFKKQTLLSQRRCRAAAGCAAPSRSRIALFSPFAVPSVRFPPAFFLFRARSVVKGVWQNLNCETSVGRPARKPEVSARAQRSLSLSFSSVLVSSLLFTAARRSFIRASPSPRAFVFGRIIFCHRMIIKISAIMMLSLWPWARASVNRAAVYIAELRFSP